MSRHGQSRVIPKMGLFTDFALDFFKHGPAGQAFCFEVTAEGDSGEGVYLFFGWAWVPDEFHTAHLGQRRDFGCFHLLGLFTGRFEVLESCLELFGVSFNFSRDIVHELMIELVPVFRFWGLVRPLLPVGHIALDQLCPDLAVGTPDLRRFQFE